MQEETKLVHAGRHIADNYDFVNPPVIRASTVLHRSAEDMLNRAEHERNMEPDKVPYGTYGTPTHHAFYKALMALEGEKAAGAWAFPSGLAACTIPLLAFLKAGDHALFIDTIYGPTREFAEEMLTRLGIEVEFFPPDIGQGIVSVIDNTWATPLFFKPLEVGVNVVIHKKARRKPIN